MCPVLMTPFLLKATQMAWDWSRVDTPMPGLRVGISDIIRQSVLMSHDTWQRDIVTVVTMSTQISLYCSATRCRHKMCQYWEIVSECGALVWDQYQQVTIYIFISTDTSTINVLIFISVNIKWDELSRSASVGSTNISADDHDFNGKLILCYLICVQKLEFPLQYFIWVEHKMSIKCPWLWHIMTYTFQRNLENTTNIDLKILQPGLNKTIFIKV